MRAIAEEAVGVAASGLKAPGEKGRSRVASKRQRQRISPRSREESGEGRGLGRRVSADAEGGPT